LTCSGLEVMITSSSEVCKDFESNMVLRYRQLGNLTSETAKYCVMAKHTVGYSILTHQLQATKSGL
jgi:hypothetical protein